MYMWHIFFILHFMIYNKQADGLIVVIYKACLEQLLQM